MSRLNGDGVTMAGLHLPDMSSLAVGGGGDAGFNMSLTTAGEEFFCLRNPFVDGDDTVALIVGGQLGHYPRRWVVDLGAATAAAREFAHDGCRSSHLLWDRV